MEATPEAAALNKIVTKLVRELGLVIFKLDGNIKVLSNEFSDHLEVVYINNNHLLSASELSKIVGLTVLHFRSTLHITNKTLNLITSNSDRFEGSVVLSVIY